MALVCWKDEYSVHVKVIDEQHKWFFELINRLATVKNGDSPALGAILDELLDYAVYHFSIEERIWTEHGCPQFEEHKESHRKFIHKVVLVGNDLKEGKDIQPNQVMEWAGSWLLRHILKRDQQLIPYVGEKKSQ